MKTITSILLGFTLFLLNTTANGQSLFGASVVVGGNITQLTGDQDPGFNKIGFHAGVKGIINVNYRSEIGIGIQYDQRGSRSTLRGQNANNPFKISLDYVTVPVTYSFKDWFDEEDGYYKVHFMGGLAYGRLFQSFQEGNQIDPLCFAGMPEDDLSWILGASYFINKHWGVSVFHLRSLFTLKPEREVAECSYLLPYQWTMRLEYKF